MNARTSKSPKRGRPARRKVAATARISIRVTDAEHRELRRRAGDQPLGVWLRNLVLGPMPTRFNAPKLKIGRES